MKKLLIAALIVVSFTTSVFASNKVAVSSKAMAHLEANYAGAKNVSWTVSDNFEKATITMGNEKIDVYYNGYGDLIGSAKTMAFDKLPKSALDIITTAYTFPEYQLTDCIAFTDDVNNTNYYVSFDDIDGAKVVLAISANGSVTPM